MPAVGAVGRAITLIVLLLFRLKFLAASQSGGVNKLFWFNHFDAARERKTIAKMIRPHKNKAYDGGKDQESSIRKISQINL